MSVLGDSEFSVTANGYQWRWEREGIMLAITRLRDRSEGLYGRVAAYATSPPNPPQIMSASEFRLLSTQGQNTFSKHLRAKSNTLEWGEYIEAVCLHALQEFEKPTPAEWLTGEEVDLTTEYLVRPLLVKNEPNMIYGDGDSYKSLLALMLSYFLGLGGDWLGFRFAEPCNVLYLDYETSKRVVDQRIFALQKAWRRDTTGNISYLRCEKPLVDDASNIHQRVIDNNIGLVIVDSYGMACGGDILSQDIARQTIEVLRYLRTTALGITHVPTETVRNNSAKPTPYGNRYWHNLHRWSWWANAHTDDTVSILALTHDKHNVGPHLTRPIGLRIEWKDNVPYVKRDDAAVLDTPELRGRGMTQKEQIKTVLRHGALTVEEISADTQLSTSRVRTMLNRHKDTFVRIEGSWGLLSHEG